MLRIETTVQRRERQVAAGHRRATDEVAIVALRVRHVRGGDMVDVAREVGKQHVAETRLLVLVVEQLEARQRLEPLASPGRRRDEDVVLARVEAPLRARAAVRVEVVEARERFLELRQREWIHAPCAHVQLALFVAPGVASEQEKV